MKRPRRPDYDELMTRHLSPMTRAILYYAAVGAYIETLPGKDERVQGGYINKIIRDQYGIPACFRVTCHTEEGERYDYIPAPSVFFYEPYDTDTPDPSEFGDREYDAWCFPERCENPFQIIENEIRGMCERSPAAGGFDEENYRIDLLDTLRGWCRGTNKDPQEILSQIDTAIPITLKEES